MGCSRIVTYETRITVPYYGLDHLFAAYLFGFLVGFSLEVCGLRTSVLKFAMLGGEGA